MSVGWVAAGTALVGGAMSANAASKASKAQERAADQANDTQRYMYDTTRADNADFLNNGRASNNQLAYLLGVSNTPGGSAGNTALTREQIREELMPQFESQKWVGDAGGYISGQNSWGGSSMPGIVEQPGPDGRIAVYDGEGQIVGYRGGMQSSLDEAGLNAAIEARLQKQAAATAAAGTAAQNDPAHGSLMRDFSEKDFWADPVTKLGFQFGMDEGTKGLNRMAAANGSLNSGANLKALTRFGNDYGSTKGNESFNRFNVNQSNKFNRLATLSGVGQVASGQIGSAGQSMANNVSQNQIGAGNARAASAISGANAISGAIGQGYNMYMGNQLMNRLPQQYGVPQQPGVTGWNSQG